MPVATTVRSRSYSSLLWNEPHAPPGCAFCQFGQCRPPSFIRCSPPQAFTLISWQLEEYVLGIRAEISLSHMLQKKPDNSCARHFSFYGMKAERDAHRRGDDVVHVERLGAIGGCCEGDLRILSVVFKQKSKEKKVTGPRPKFPSIP